LEQPLDVSESETMNVKGSSTKEAGDTVTVKLEARL
jgi:hypothetical protein